MEAHANYVSIRLPMPVIELYVKKKNWRACTKYIKKNLPLESFIDNYNKYCKNDKTPPQYMKSNLDLFVSRFKGFDGPPSVFLRNEILGQFLHSSNSMLVANLALLSELFSDKEVYQTYVDSLALYNFVGLMQETNSIPY